jgi:glutamyl-tRNA reductase
VAAEVASFEEWYRSLELTPTIIALRERFQEVMRSELERTLPRLSSLSDSERKSLERMCDAAVSKLLHSPLSRLKEGSRSPDGPQLIDTARRLFDLDREALSEDAAETTSDRAQATMVQLSAASNRSGDSS